MGQVSTEEGWWLFLQLCQSAKSPEQLDDILNLLFTIDEKEAIATRCQIVKALLEAKQPQREIAADLGVSIAKITRGSNALKRASESLKKFLSKKMRGS